MKTIKDAVLDLNGKLPSREYTKHSSVAGWYLTKGGGLAHFSSCVWFDVKEFEAEAKRMGYINGYLWGVEYQTDGNCPDLDDDVLVEAKLHNGPWHPGGEDAVDEFHWEVFSHFRITDQRYKPEPESASLDGRIVMTSESIEVASGNSLPGDFPFATAVEPAKTWFEAGELPPIGSKVCVTGSGSYDEVIIVAHDKGVAVVRLPDGEKYWGVNICYLRPLRIEREKFIDAAVSAVGGSQAIINANAVLGKLFDAGFRAPDAK